MAIDLSISVLVVDDYDSMRRAIRRVLTLVGFMDVDLASSGLDAFEMMKQKKYGLVISDLHMGGMSGIELLKLVRADQDLAATPFIIATADEKTENAIAAKEAGANNFIVKRFNAATLRKKIEEVFPD